MVTAAGGAAGEPSGAAGVVRISLGSCWVAAAVFSADFGEVARWWQQHTGYCGGQQYCQLQMGQQ